VSKSAIFDFFHADIIRFNFVDHEVGLILVIEKSNEREDKKWQKFKFSLLSKTP